MVSYIHYDDLWPELHMRCDIPDKWFKTDLVQAFAYKTITNLEPILEVDAFHTTFKQALAKEWKFHLRSSHNYNCSKLVMRQQRTGLIAVSSSLNISSRLQQNEMLAKFATYLADCGGIKMSYLVHCKSLMSGKVQLIDDENQELIDELFEAVAQAKLLVVEKRLNFGVADIPSVLERVVELQKESADAAKKRNRRRLQAKENVVSIDDIVKKFKVS